MRIGFVVLMIGLWLLLDSKPGLSEPVPEPSGPGKVYLSVESQRLHAALEEFSKQSGVALFAETRLLNGKTSASVRGYYYPQDAIAILLAETGLTIRAADNNVFVVLKADDRPTARVARSKPVETLPSRLDELTVYGRRTTVMGESRRRFVGNAEELRRGSLLGVPSLGLADTFSQSTGVLVTKDSGESRQVSMRGLDPNFTQVRINDVEALFITDSGIDQRGGAARTRSFDFSVFAAELFDHAKIAKTYDVDEWEGGIAGSIALYTAKPFDYDREGWNGALSIKALYNERTEGSSPRFAALLGNRWGDFGALLSVAYSEADTVEEGYHVWSWRQASFGSDNVASSVDPAVADRLINAAGDDRVFVPRANNIASWFNTRERTGITAALQWQPSDRASFDLDVLYGELSNDRIENQISTAGTNAFTGDVITPDNTALLTDAAIDGGDLVFAAFENLDLRTESKISVSETRFHQVSLNTGLEFSDRHQARLLLSSSRSRFDMPVHDKVFAEAAGHQFSVDWRGARFGKNRYDFDVTDFSEWSLMRTDVREDRIANNFDILELDFERQLADRRSLEYGAQLKLFETSGFERRNRVDWEDDPSAPAAVFQLTEIPVLRPFAIADNRATFELVENTGRISRHLDASFNTPGSAYEVEEDTLAFYLKYNGAATWRGKSIRGNLGARWFRTRQASRGELGVGHGFEPEAFRQSYDYLLPALNVALDLTNRWIWRFSASRNISRPNINALRAAAKVEVADTAIEMGNPAVKPFTVDAYESSIDYYGDSRFLSLAVFHKRTDSFITQRSQTVPYRLTGFPLEFLIVDPRVGPDSEFTVSQPVNTEGVDVSGFELAFQADFTHLPEPLNHLGIAGNYSYADGATTLFSEGRTTSASLPGLSKSSYYLTVYYRSKNLGVSLSSTFRDAYVTGEGESQTVVAGYDDTTFVDLGAFYALSDNIQLTLEGINLTDQPIRQFLDHRTQSYTTSGTNWLLGLTGRF